MGRDYRYWLAGAALALLGLSATAAQAQGDCDAECQALRDAQDPLADVTAIMTDNTIAWGGGTSDNDPAYTFQIQPVKSFETNLGFNFIARGMIPIMGAPQSYYLPYLGNVGGTGTTWGLSDIMLQGFFVPQTDSDFKFGFGPQFSLRTRTDEAVGGPGWGAGFSLVAFGFAGDLSYGGLVGHLWGQDGFSLTSIQPIVMYNLPLFGGSYVGYNNSITYDWSAQAWQAPVGLTFGKTFLFESGHALDASVGGYYVAARPTGAPDTQVKFGLNFFFP